MFPRWLSWMFIAVMLYMIYAASQWPRVGQTPVATPLAVPERATPSYPALAEVTDVEAWKRKINPDYAAVMNCALDAPEASGALAFNVIEEKAGEGATAACGDTITIALMVWNEAAAPGFQATLPLALGSRELAAGLDVGLVGIKPGGVRTLLLPPYALVRGKGVKAMEAARKALPEGKLAVVTVTRVTQPKGPAQ